MPKARREFTIGEKIGVGGRLTVISSERVRMPQSPGSVNGHTLGIQVRCPECGRAFVVSITNVSRTASCGCRRGPYRNRKHTEAARAARHRAALRRLEPKVREYEDALRSDLSYVEELAHAYWLQQEDDGGLAERLREQHRQDYQRQYAALQKARAS